MSINSESFKNSPPPVQYEKRNIPDILNDSESIDTKAAAKEILTWIANNVEQFIDNQKRKFKLDLIIDAEEGAQETMPVTRKLQDLYRAIPNDPVSADNLSLDLPQEELDKLTSEKRQQLLFQMAIDSLTEKEIAFMERIMECRSVLDEISNKIFQAMKDNHELLVVLFKRMAFYYEMQGISGGDILLEEFNGEVDILKFEYEAFPVSVQITATVGDSVKEYTIPEGFTIWLELAFKSKKREMASIF